VKNLSVRRWMTTGMGSMFRVVQTGSGRTSGMVTDDSETFRLDNMESGVVGRACGAPDRGGISKNGSNKQFIEG
jgi:hypothetical protein